MSTVKSLVKFPLLPHRGSYFSGGLDSVYFRQRDSSIFERSPLILRRRGVNNFIDKEEKILHYLNVSKMLA